MKGSQCIREMVSEVGACQEKDSEMEICLREECPVGKREQLDRVEGEVEIQ